MTIDISDLPSSASAAVKSFVSNVRDGYRTQKGDWASWLKAASVISQASPVMYFGLCVGIGSLMRPMFRSMPGCILHIKGGSTTGKTIALQTILSLRADPSDITWCFDGPSTLKWYTIAAEHNFLCLDDLHVAIMPDTGPCRPVPAAYFANFEGPTAPHTTIISTSVLGLDELAKHSFLEGFEIDAADKATKIWPVNPDLDPWWMDAWMSELKSNYGIAVDRIGDSLVNDHQTLIMEEARLQKAMPERIRGGRRSLLILAQLGRYWLQNRAGLYIDAFPVYDAMAKKRNA
jgi:hypothetical protein